MPRDRMNQEKAQENTSSQTIALEDFAKLCKKTMADLLLGDWVFEIDTRDPGLAYHHTRHPIAYEKLSTDKKERYQRAQKNFFNACYLLISFAIDNSNLELLTTYLLEVIQLGHYQVLLMPYSEEFNAKPQSLFEDAMCCLLGLPEDKNPQKAMRALSRIKKKNKIDYAKAQFLLGVLHATGIGCEIDNQKAHKYLKHAKKEDFNISAYFTSHTPRLLNCFGFFSEETHSAPPVIDFEELFSSAPS